MAVLRLNSLINMRKFIEFFIVLLIAIVLVKSCHLSFIIGNCRVKISGTYIEVDSVMERRYNRL